MAEEARKYLEQEGFYDHFGKIINKVVTEKPRDAYGLVEVLSRLVKQEDAAPDAPQEDEEAVLELARHAKKLRLLGKVPADESGPVAVCAVPDFMQDAELLSWAGVGFGAQESYQVACSLRKLAFKEREAGLVKIRFWGKVLGVQADYWVAEVQKEAEGDAPDPEGPDADMEPLGTGANKFAYYATTDLTGEWRLLPDIKPREIVAARRIKKLLTGNPEAPVITHPYFAGNEDVFLRAQIARITADTVLCISGFMKREEEEEDAVPEEDPEFVSPPAAELLKKQGWTHMMPHVLLTGRTAYEELPEEDEEEPDPQVKKLREQMQADPARDLIRGLEEDGLEWTIKQAGDTALYKNGSDPAAKPKCNAVTYVRSLTWPGAVCAAQGNRFVNVYVGYGLRAGEPDFFFPAPPDVQEEPEDPGEQPEPQGSEDPPEGAEPDE